MSHCCEGETHFTYHSYLYTVFCTAPPSSGQTFLNRLGFFVHEFLFPGKVGNLTRYSVL